MIAFRGDLDFCSNFYAASVMYDGMEYPTSEHAFQAAKTLDLQERSAILNADTPGKAKKLGYVCNMRPDWPLIRIEVMRQILLSKFTINHELRRRLVATGDTELVEHNTWGDKFWGVCEGEGENHLGKSLMLVRSLINLIKED